MTDKDKAQAQFSYLKQYLYNLGKECQALVNSIHEETETFLSDKDFSQMDFKKIELLAKDLQLKQKDFKAKVEKFNKLKDDFGFSE